MGILEAAVVVYLRALYYPDGFGFPLALMEPSILRTEIVREAMTLVMLVSLAWIAADRLWPRLIAFLVVFGVWDLTYYAGLKLFLDWPASFLEPDILFLFPAIWIGPVLAPALVAVTWVVGGLWLHRAGPTAIGWGWREWIAGGTGCLLILASFLIHTGTREDPGFLWGLFAIGYALGLIVLIGSVIRSRRAGTGRVLKNPLETTSIW